MSADEERYTGLCLPETHLFVANGQLLRKDDKGNEVGRFDLEDIQDVSIRKTFDPISLVFFVAGGGLILAGCYAIENEILKWLSVLAGIAGCSIGSLSTTKAEIKLKIKGQNVEYLAEEDYEIVQGFVVSLKVRLNKS